MRKTAIITGLSIAVITVFGTASTVQGEPRAVDYLKLTRANLPHVKSLQKAVLKNLDFQTELLRDIQRRIQLSALLPYSVALGYGLDDDAVSNFGTNGKRTYAHTPTSSTSEYTTFGETYGALPNQNSDSESVSLSMTWNLADVFGHNVDKLYAVSDVMSQNDQESFAIVEVAKRCAKLMVALPERAGEEISSSQIYVIYENASILDSLSGLMITKALKAEAGAKVVVVGNDGVALKQEMQKTEVSLLEDEAPVAEVADGQDDNVEIIGGAVDGSGF